MTPRLRWVVAAAVALATACSGKSGPAGPAGSSGPAASVEGTITGVVRDPVGPLAGATVVAQPGDFQVTTLADGVFTLRVPVGLYVVTAEKEGFTPSVSDPTSVVAGGVAELGPLLSPLPPAPVTAAAGSDLFQAGFGTQVQLDGTGSVGADITYSWRQVPRSGPEVVLDDPSSPTPSFTTKTLEELEAGGFYAIRRSLGNLGFSEADVDRSTYEFELIVTDGITASSDRVIIRSVVGQPGLRVVPVDTVVPISAGEQADYAWSCSFQDNDGNRAPCGTGVLTGANTRNPTLRADLTGTYTLTTPGEAPLELRAAFYIGARQVGDPVTGEKTCFSCHRSRHDAWAATKHATYLQRALSGNLVDKTGQHVTYRGECMRCHTTGFNPGANNGGFTQVAAAESWGFPDTFEAMSPQLQALASVTCENCHGPGGLHRLAQTVEQARLTIGKSFAAVDCSQCHATEPYENQGLQWVNSRHSQFITGPGFRPGAGDPALIGFCASCHSSQGFVAWTDRGVSTAPPVSADVTEPQTCTACHDQHGEATFAGLPTPNMLRIYGDVTTLVPGMGAKGVGPAALCMTCHNSRTSVAVATEAGAAPASQAAPHTPSQADVLLAKNAATFGGPAYPSSVHTGVPKLCVGCHMAPTPPIGAVGHNLVGGHSFAVKAGAIVNMAACTTCHPALDGFNRTAYGDYDGDGFLEGIQTEVTGLQARVQEQLSLAAGRLWFGPTGGGTPAVVSFHGQVRVLKSFDALTDNPACSPAADPEGWTAAGCFAFPAGAIPQLTPEERQFLEAAWNYFLIQGDRSRGIHNAAFSVSVLQRSYQALAGQPVPGAIIR